MSCLTEGNSIGVVVPIKGKSNKFIVGRDRDILLFSWDDKTDNTGSFEKLTSVDKRNANNQFNDGKVDKNGRLWIGTFFVILY